MATAAEGGRLGTTSKAWYRSKRNQVLIQKTIVYILLIFFAIMFIVPVLWMLSTSLKGANELYSGGWIPNPALFSNYPDALTNPLAPFGVYAQNTIIIAVLSTAGAVLTSSLVAYSFARLRWPGREFWFGIVLATMILPGIVTFIPQYILFSTIGWTNSFKPLIVPAWFGGGAFYIFLLRQFYRGIPMELSEAAHIDGAGELRIWWQIVMPLARPALTAVTIFAFNGAWEDYFGPLIYLGDKAKYTLQLGLTTFESAGGGNPQYNLMMAASIVVMIPIIIIFFVGQKYFIEGVQLTGMGGR